MTVTCFYRAMLRSKSAVMRLYIVCHSVYPSVGLSGVSCSEPHSQSCVPVYRDRLQTDMLVTRSQNSPIKRSEIRSQPVETDRGE